MQRSRAEIVLKVLTAAAVAVLVLVRAIPAQLHGTHPLAEESLPSPNILV
jgi:hypothetical protein